MRVVMVIGQFHPVIGGAEQQAQKLARSLVDRGIKVEIVTEWLAGLPLAEVIDGIPVSRIFGFGRLPGTRRIGKYIFMALLCRHLIRRRHEYSIVHCHQIEYPLIGCILASYRTKKPIISKLSGANQNGDFGRLSASFLGGRKIANWVQHRVDRFIATSNQIYCDLIQRGIGENAIARIPNGVVVGPNPASLNTNRVLYVGRLAQIKGVDILLQAWTQVIQAWPNLKLVIIGDGPMREQLEAFAKDAGISESIEFHGFLTQAEIQTQLREGGIYVQPSRSEGLSNSLLEAMAAALPCIATAVGGNIDLIQHKETGLLVAPEDPSALASAIDGLLLNHQSAESLGTQANKFARKAYSIDSVAENYIRLYQDLLDSNDSFDTGRRG